MAKDAKKRQGPTLPANTPVPNIPEPVDLRTANKSDKKQLKSLIKLGIYSSLMFCAPFATFVASCYTYLDPLYEVTIGIPSPDKRTTVGGILAVIVANIVVGLFVLTAFNDEDSEDTEVSLKQD